MKGYKPEKIKKDSWIKSLFSQRFTFMVIPHGPGNPRQINIRFSFITAFLLTWTGITFWGAYLSSQHVDYWRTRLSNQVLKLKINYLLSQLDNSRKFMDEVKQMEFQLRELLQYKNEADIIQEKKPPTSMGATGGPSEQDQKDISNLLQNVDMDISWARLIEHVDHLRSEAKIRLANYGDISKHISQKKNIYMATPRGWPAQGRITSHFGKRIDPFTGVEDVHYGVDIANKQGTPVRATANGTVRLASWHSGYGNLVVLSHEFGYNTLYAHNSKLLVKTGDNIERGQIIALIGATGKASGSHVHYEVWMNNKRQNPYAYLNGKYPEFHDPNKPASVVGKKGPKPLQS